MHLKWHFFDVHSIEEPRSNCVTRKRKWQLQPELTESHFESLSDKILPSPDDFLLTTTLPTTFEDSDMTSGGETLPSTEDCFLAATLPTSFEDSDMSSIDDVFMEFISLDHN